MTDLDIGAVFAAFFVAWLGPKLGPVLGIYTVILIAAIVGSGFAIARREPNSRPAAWLFAALMTVATMIVTMPATLLFVHYFTAMTAQITAPLMALLIAAVGEDWTRVFGWGWGFVRRWVGQKSGVGDQQP